MSLNIPNVFVGGPGHPALASEVNANFAAIAAHFTEGSGGIKDEDISSSAAINANKLSNIAGKRVPTDRIEDNAVTGDKLKDDPAAGHPNAGVNLADHIKDRLIASIKLVLASIGKDVLNVVEVTQAFSFGASGGPTLVNVAIGTTPALPAITTILPLHVTFDSIAWSGGATGVADVRIGITNAGAVVFLFLVTTSSPCTISGTLRLRYIPAS